MLAWSFAAWLVLLASTLMVERAVVHGLAWPSGALALVATTYAQAIPSSAASIGVFEAAARQALSTFGVASAAALAFALIYHAVSILPLLPLGVAGVGRLGVRLPAGLASCGRHDRAGAVARGIGGDPLPRRAADDRGRRRGGVARPIALAGADGEVVVVDNGSTDGSAQLAAEAGARVIHESRRGYGSAYLAGLHAARGRYILMGDGDGTYDFTALPAFLRRCRGGADLVMGSRLRARSCPGRCRGTTAGSATRCSPGC